MTLEMFIAFILQAVKLSSVLLLGSTGEILTEKSGNLNLGTPGIMACGAISGVVGAYMYTSSFNSFNPIVSILITLAFCIVGSLLASLIYAFLTITLKTNQNVTGLILTTFGIGLSNCIGSMINNKMSGNGISAFPDIGKAYRTCLPFADDLGIIGKLLFSYGFMTYLAIIIAIIVAITIKRTRIGLNLRAVGENPATADAAGINVNKYKYSATCIGGIISGMGGLYYVMDFANANWQNDILDQFGWLAVALVIFTIWRPVIAIFGSIIFGALYVIGPFLPLGLLSNSEKKLLTLLPYVVTIIVLVLTSMLKKREYQPPESLGLSYFREER